MILPLPPVFLIVQSATRWPSSTKLEPMKATKSTPGLASEGSTLRSISSTGMPAFLAAITAGISGFSSRGGRKMKSTPCAIIELTSATCLAAEPAASV